jgi:hypothetical protein
MTLKRPILSATGPGRPRPRVEAAFIIDRMCCAMLSKLLDVAYEVMYAGGTNTAQSSIKIADMVNTKRTSRNPSQSRARCALALRERRVLSSRVPSKRQTVLSKAKHLMVQAKPI